MMACEAYLQAGFGPPLGKPYLDRIKALGFFGIRLSTDEAAVRELGEYGDLAPILCIGAGNEAGWTAQRFYDNVTETTRLIARNCYFYDVPLYLELFNEPDLHDHQWKHNPELLAAIFCGCYEIAKSRCGDVKMVTPAISNLHKNGLKWLERFLSAQQMPADAIIGFHRYANGYKLDKPHEGFHSRDYEMGALQYLADGRKLLCTETGLSEGPHRQAKRFPLCFMNDKIWLSQEQQAEAFKHEWDFYKQRDNVLGMTWYQHRDGVPIKNILSNYGLYTAPEFGPEREKAICQQIRELLL